MRFRKPMIFLFACIAFIVYISMQLYPKDQQVTSVISTQQANHYMQIYMKDDDELLVPLSIAVNEEESEEDKLRLMFAYLSGKQKMKGFTPLFQKECFLNDVMIKDGVAKLFFDASLKNYKPEDELRVLEAITWGATQFKSVQAVELYLNEQRMDQMPLAATPIPQLLDRSIGINHFETSTTSLHDSTSLTVFSTKKIGSREFLVPRSRRCQFDEQDIATQVALILEDISASSGLRSLFSNNHIKTEKVVMENGSLQVMLNDHILASDSDVKQNVLDTLVLSLATLPSVQDVEIRVGNELIYPQKEENKQVSLIDMTYNELEF